MNFSIRSKMNKLSSINGLEDKAKKAERRGIEVIGLNAGQPDVPTPPEFMDAIRNTDVKVISYTETHGWLPLRNSIAGYYAMLGLDIKPQDIVITMGSSEAILWALIMTCDPGDEVIIPEPFYVSYRGIATALSIHVKAVRTADDFSLPSYDVLKTFVTPRTRAILLTNPGNPTGHVYSNEEMCLAAKLAKEHNLFIIADEVYREFNYSDHETRSFTSMDDIKDHVILLDSASKRFSACGARIGCLCSRNPEIIEEALKLAQTRVSPPYLEMVGCKALFEMEQDYFDSIREIFRKRRDFLINCLNKIPRVNCQKPEGAFYVIVTIPVDDAARFSEWLLNEYNYQNRTIMLTPMENFYETSDKGLHEVRLAFVLSEEKLRLAIDILGHALEAYPGKI